MNHRLLALCSPFLLLLTGNAWGQYPVRGLPEANRVYAYGGYSAYAPVARYTPPHVGYPVGMPQANTTYYAPATAAPVATPTPYVQPQTAMSAYYSPISSYTPTINYAYRPTTYGSSLIPATNPGYGYGVPSVSPFVRPQPYYAPPVYTYRPGTATLPVTYYRPVTVYDPVSGVPVTYMSGCTGKECYSQPQRTWSGLFQHHKLPCASGNCASGSCVGPNCGAAPTPYYPTPGAAPVAPAPGTVPAPGGWTYPSAQPPLPRTTVPPPATINPGTTITTPPGGGFITPPAPTNFGTPGAGLDPANVPPNLNAPPTNLSPGGLPSSGGTFPPGSTFTPGTTTNYPPNDQQPTTDGKSFYYYRGVVREPFSGQPSRETAPMTGPTSTQRPEESKAMPMQPMNNSPPMTAPSMSAPKMESGTSFRGFAPPEGYRANSSFQESSSNVVPVVPMKPESPPVAPEFKPSVIPVIRPPQPDVRPVPDPEPNRPLNRAPQLLNPRDKTASREVPTTSAGYEQVKLNDKIETPVSRPASSEGWRSVGR